MIIKISLFDQILSVCDVFWEYYLKHICIMFLQIFLSISKVPFFCFLLAAEQLFRQSESHPPRQMPWRMALFIRLILIYKSIIGFFLSNDEDYCNSRAACYQN